MESTLKIGTINQLEENCVIYKEGQLLQSVALLLKGTVTMYNAGCRMTLGPGNFIGIHDLYIGKYSFTCETNETCSLYIFKGRGMADLSEIVNLNKDYKGYIIRSLNLIICNLYDNYYRLKTSGNDIFQQVKEIMSKYQDMVMGYGGSVRSVKAYDRMSEFDKMLPVKEEWIEGIKEKLQVPRDILGAYYSYLPNLALREMEEKIKITTILMEQLHQIVGYINELNNCLFNDGNDCVFKAICQEVMQLASSHANYTDMTELVDHTVELVNQIENIYEECMGRSILVNRAMMEKLYFAMIAEKDASSLFKDEDVINEDTVMLELSGSLEQILEYGQVPLELGEHFKECIKQFAELTDKYQVSDDIRVLRKAISKDFYEIYEAVFKIAYRTGEYSKAVELFLNFGYVDEHLLTKEQLVELYRYKICYQSTHYCLSLIHI